MGDKQSWGKNSYPKKNPVLISCDQNSAPGECESVVQERKKQ